MESAIQLAIMWWKRCTIQYKSSFVSWSDSLRKVTIKFLCWTWIKLIKEMIRITGCNLMYLYHIIPTGIPSAIHPLYSSRPTRRDKTNLHVYRNWMSQAHYPAHTCFVVMLSLKQHDWISLQICVLESEKFVCMHFLSKSKSSKLL